MTNIHWYGAGLTGLAGGAMAQTMVIWGGDMAQHLPPAVPFMICACLGASLAGLISGGLFGRNGWLGYLLALGAWPFVTALGSWFGAALFLGVSEVAASRMPGPVDLAEGAGMMGFIAIVDGITTSWPVAGVWIAAPVLLHRAMRAQRVAHP